MVDLNALRTQSGRHRWAVAIAFLLGGVGRLAHPSARAQHGDRGRFAGNGPIQMLYRKGVVATGS